MNKSLSKIIAKSPQSPGIYKFISGDEIVLYIGKAKNLKKRLQSYIRPSTKHTTKTKKMLESAKSVEWVETNSELEALILEDNLIKKLRPKYNILLKDSKTFQYIKVTIQNDYPEVITVRKIEKDGAKYFGPKTSGTDVARVIESAKRIFKLCSSKNISIDEGATPIQGSKVAVKIGGIKSTRPCLDYHIKRCTGPCAGIVAPEEYRKQINEVIKFLSGDYQSAINTLRSQMLEYASNKKFERAASVRDHIESIERMAEKQLIADTNLLNRDVIAYVEDLGKNYFILFQIRLGKIIAQEKFISEGGDSPIDVMESFLRDYYSYAADIPKEVIISISSVDNKVIGEYISSQTDHKVKVICPKAGKKDKLIELAEKNARSFARQSRVRWMADERNSEKALEDLKTTLKLKNTPKRIECYDISHFAGTETVGSMVVFKKGKAYKPDYRQFRLRSTVGKIDDYKSMEEVITRRLNYLPAELPDGYKVRKAKKSDSDFILKTNLDLENLNFDIKEFYVIDKNSKIVGFGRIHSLSDKIHQIDSVWVSEAERGKKLGYHIFNNLIERSKFKRFYLFCKPELEEYYLKYGFDLLKQPPKELSKASERYCSICTVGNTEEYKKPLYFAYQKKKKDRSFTSKPDLIVIDGGKGQLNAANQIVFNKGIDIPVISLAKKHEEVFRPGKSEPIDIKKDSNASYLLQRVRDEAHRFAIEYNRTSRDKKMVKSGLDSIPGVGPKIRKKLLAYFGSVYKIKESSQAVLEQVVGEKLAKEIKDQL